MELDYWVENVGSKDNKTRKLALDKLLEITNDEVDWIYDIWDIFSRKLYANNSYQRSIGVFLLSNLAKSDYEHKFVEVVDRYLSLMEDEKFVTSRQTIQNTWKVAIAYDEIREKIVDHMMKMFTENKFLQVHANLIRKDIVSSLCMIRDVHQDAVDIVELELKIEMHCHGKEKKELMKLLDIHWDN